MTLAPANGNAGPTLGCGKEGDPAVAAQGPALSVPSCHVPAFLGSSLLGWGRAPPKYRLLVCAHCISR